MLPITLEVRTAAMNGGRRAVIYCVDLRPKILHDIASRSKRNCEVYVRMSLAADQTRPHRSGSDCAGTDVVAGVNVSTHP